MSDNNEVTGGNNANVEQLYGRLEIAQEARLTVAENAQVGAAEHPMHTGVILDVQGQIYNTGIFAEAMAMVLNAENIHIIGADAFPDVEGDA